ncbi:cytochrome P450 [Sphingobium sp. AR-3-1]|uniref:Cytochrome P450 n=1 Tax=Sphingobium psychrophilum TaxID=2728834 RepID=A0A7X9WYP1_9SPHN|nr:cytochrome P450 [Sphingobium psychrophilum]NML12360.1 cytochrome P450 [Sphingobium psychrophilum]
MSTAQLMDIPEISPLASREDYAAARRRSWVGKSERGFEVLTHDQGWEIMSSKAFDIGGGFGVVLDAVDLTSGPYREEWNKQIVCHEGDMRTKMREPYMRLLKPQQVAKLQGDVRAIIHGILDDIKDPTDVDFMAEIAWRLPTQLYCDLISAPREMAPWIGRVTESINPPLLMMDKDRIGESEAAYWEGLAFIEKHIDDKRGNLGDDFTSELIRCELEGLISHDQVKTLAMSLLIASMDNTLHQLGLTFGTLLEDRSRWEQVLARPTAAPQAAEESYRLCPRFGVIARHASKDIAINGFTFPADSWIWISTRSGGRDESKFDDADNFRMGRPASRALMFGSNHYSCLGATLARLEVSETIRIIADRFPNIHIKGDWRKVESPLVTEVEHLRVSLI